MCESCGGPKEIGGYCTSCWEKRTVARKKRVAAKKARGECTTCDQPAEKGKTKCSDCLRKYREMSRALVEKKLAAGLCKRCGKNPFVEGSQVCGQCFCKGVSKFHFHNCAQTDQLMALLEAQDNICPYTGKKLVMGLNCTLDHIVPVSRGGTNDIDNLQWVYCSEFVNVNTLKWSMTDTEFRELIKIVYEHTVGADDCKI